MHDIDKISSRCIYITYLEETYTTVFTNASKVKLVEFHIPSPIIGGLFVNVIYCPVDPHSHQCGSAGQ